MYEAKFSDLSSISLLSELEELDITSGRNISDISPLGSLSTLKKLSLINIDNDNIESIEVLSHLTNLEHLEIWYDDKYYRELLPLQNLAVLKITLLYQKDFDLHYIAKLHSLKEFELHFSFLNPNLFNVDQLQNLTNIERLSIRFANTLDISWISNLQKLKELELQGSTILDITPLLLLPELTDVNLLRTTVKDITPLLESTTIKSIFGPIVENGGELMRLFSERGINFQPYSEGDR